MKASVFVNNENEEYYYRLVACCKEDVENHIRVLFILYIGNNNDLMLSSLTSYDSDKLPSLSIIEANIISYTKQETSLEKIASFLTLENGVSSIKWEINNIDVNS